MPSSLGATIGKLGYVAGMLAMVSAGTANIVLGAVKDAPLDGVEVTAKKPDVGFGAIVKERFQTEATAWFDQHWGLRGYAVRTDNTVVMSLFGEARSGQAIVARGGVLISEDDAGHVNRPDPPERAIASAELVARVQRKMLARGKIIVPVVIPAKTTFYRAEVPWNWRRRGGFELSDTNVYGAFVRTLEEKGAKFVDARALLARENSRPEQVFTKTGRHWRMSAGCRALQAALDVARPDLPELGDDQIDCHTRVDRDAPLIAEDYDLFRLLNVWNAKPRDIDVDVLDGAKATPRLRVPTIFVGSSFVWKFVRVSQELEVLQPSLFYYYDASVVDTSTLLITKKVEPFTDGWREDTFSKRLFILAILETYIPADGERFLQELDKEIDAHP